MSRRESRDSDHKQQSSKFDREPSPKRSRRDGKSEAERVLSKKDLDVKDGSDTDKKPRQSLRDAVPLEPHSHGSRKDSETTKQAPRSRPYHQHDDLPSAGKADKRETSERGSWRGSRDQINGRAGDDEKSQHRKDEDRTTRRHDRFHESDDTRGALSRKRPPFREKKISDEPRNNTDRTRTEEAKDINPRNSRQNERKWRSSMHSDRYERPAMGRDRAWNRDDERGARSRHDYRADRDRFSINGRSGSHGNWTKDEKKWDHDLFEEANKSPTRANEEEQIAKVEALLAS